MTNQRVSWIDAAKGIGIILVVYGHVARGVFNAGLYQEQPLVTYHLIDNIIYSFHMPLFFFLSGLFFLRSFDKRGSRLILNKIDTIFYPYLIWSIIQGVIEIILSQYTNGTTSFGNLIAILWLPIAQFWFLYALLLIFIFNTVIFIFLERYFKPLNIPFIIFGIGFFLFLIKQYLPADYFFIRAVSYNYIYFSFGILYWRVLDGKHHSISLTLGVFVIFSLFEYLVYYTATLPSDSALIKIIITFSGILTVIFVCQNLRGTIIKILSLVGRYSMEIYLMHVIFGSGIRIVLQKIFNVNNTDIHLILGTLLGLIFPILFVKIARSTKLEFLFKSPRIISVDKIESKP
ncbi:acyltransferase 3 [Candidatus Thiomargarita nelsonii]|uniref:Acyltransferase 3 n=1 Tax=Candidatus Thiomargarita nelsonii TaxID=1003181 RepID=A0A0A6NX18_9GAMM|nr:acyltransferase 3 [Candidatus Thiomargarita nelsonii]